MTNQEVVQGQKPDPLVKASDEHMYMLLNKFDGFMFDLDGTIWHGSNLIPGAKEVLDMLRTAGKKVFFVTNSSVKSRESVVVKMRKLGLQAEQSEVFGSSYAAAQFLKEHKIRKAYAVGEQGLVDELTSVGIEALGGPADNEKTLEWVNGDEPEMDIDPEVTAVVVGLDMHINFYKLQTAMTYIRENKAIFVATNPDSHSTMANGRAWCGAGTMVSAVKGCSEEEPFIVGKPYTTIMDLVDQVSGCPRSKLCIIGDRLDTDVQWAADCGCGALLVLSGVTSEDKLLSGELTVPSKAAPLLYVNSVADLLSVKDRMPAGWGMESCSVS